MQKKRNFRKRETFLAIFQAMSTRPVDHLLDPYSMVGGFSNVTDSPPSMLGVCE